MAHTKSAGAAKNARDSQPQYLGVKKYGGERVKIGDILIRQRGTRFVPGEGVRLARDHTLYAIRQGLVQFFTKRKLSFDGSRRLVKAIRVVESAG